MTAPSCSLVCHLTQLVVTYLTKPSLTGEEGLQGGDEVEQPGTGKHCLTVIVDYELLVGVLLFVVGFFKSHLSSTTGKTQIQGAVNSNTQLTGVL